MEIIMRKFAVLGASALVLALGVATASAEAFNPVTGYDGSAVGKGYGAAASEGRAAAIDNSQATTSSILEQFHEGK
jgi:hypothetical protein